MFGHSQNLKVEADDWLLGFDIKPTLLSKHAKPNRNSYLGSNSTDMYLYRLFSEGYQVPGHFSIRGSGKSVVMREMEQPAVFYSMHDEYHQMVSEDLRFKPSKHHLLKMFVDAWHYQEFRSLMVADTFSSIALMYTLAFVHKEVHLLRTAPISTRAHSVIVKTSGAITGSPYQIKPAPSRQFSLYSDIHFAMQPNYTPFQSPWLMNDCYE